MFYLSPVGSEGKLDSLSVLSTEASTLVLEMDIHKRGRAHKSEQQQSPQSHREDNGCHLIYFPCKPDPIVPDLIHIK